MEKIGICSKKLLDKEKGRDGFSKEAMEGDSGIALAWSLCHRVAPQLLRATCRGCLCKGMAVVGAQLANCYLGEIKSLRRWELDVM